MNDVNRQWLLTSRPNGLPDEQNFTYTEFEKPKIEPGKILLKNIYFSFEPAQQRYACADGYIPKVPLGEVMRSYTISQVMESQHPEYNVGDLVFCYGNWQDYCLEDPDHPEFFRPDKVPDYIDAKLAIFFYTSGLAGYYGLLEIGNPQPGETVYVNSAAGATGMIAAQVAKLKNCRVIGSTSRPEKVDWLLNVAKLDAAINYVDEDLGEKLGEYAPNGIDVFFDNVGGKQLDTTIAHMAKNSRIVLCGSVSQAKYIGSKIPYEHADGVLNVPALTVLRCRMQGFVDIDFYDRPRDAIEYLKSKIDDGDIAVCYDEQEGFENIPRTFKRIFTGENLGKQIMQLHPILDL